MEYIIFGVVALLFANAIRVTLKRKSFKKKCDGHCKVCTCGKSDYI